MEASKNENQESQSAENELEKTAAIVTNMALAHELVMNEGFKLEELPENSIEKQVKEIVHKAYWDKLQADLDKTPPDYTHVVTLIAELKENLLSLLLPHHNSMRAQINEVLDMELVRQQVEHDTLDLRQCAQFVVSILSKLCAPARDEQVNKLLDVTGVVDMFSEIFTLIDMMKMDMANFQLQAIKPQLLQHSLEYERGKFKQFLETNPAGLSSTTVWLSKGIEIAASAKTRASPSSGASGSTTTASEDRTDSGPMTSKVTRIEVLAYSYLGILFGDPEWPYPETLIMDELRLAEMRSVIHRSAFLSSIVLVTMGMVSRQLDKDTAFITRLKDVLLILLDGIEEGDVTASMPSIYEQVVMETDKVLEERGFTKMEEKQQAVLKGQISALGNPTHALRKLLKNRAKEYMLVIVEERLTHGNRQETGDKSIPQGLGPVSTELTELAARFARLVEHNASVYRPFYEDILDGLNDSPSN